MTREATTKAVLHQAINLMERLYHRGTGDGSLSADSDLPHVNLALRLALSAAVGQRLLTCFLSQTFSPTQAALRMLCLHSRVPLEKVVSHQLENPDFLRLTAAAGRISSSPLLFATYDPLGIEQTTQNLLRQNSGLIVLVCEKHSLEDLDSWKSELGFFARMTGASVHLLAGRLTEWFHRHSPLP